MKKTVVAFVASLVLMIAGLTACVPGICGCAFSWLPDRWERFDLSALVVAAIGLAGCVVTFFLFVVLLTRRETIKSRDAARARQFNSQ
jgi:multisubunit Na+/H+ antiporter MnhB subunit